MRPCIENTYAHWTCESKVAVDANVGFTGVMIIHSEGFRDTLDKQRRGQREMAGSLRTVVEERNI